MNVKILVAYHKFDEIIKDSVYTPIYLGKKLKDIVTKDGRISNNEFKKLNKLMLGDDTGDNISIKNRNYNEMTAVYWAWKNYEELGNPEYIGLVHYRRQFILKDTKIENEEWLKNSNVYQFEFLDNECRELINSKYLEKILQKYDGVTSCLYDLRNLNNTYASCRDRFIEMVHLSGDIYDIAMKYIYDNLLDYREDLIKFQSEPKNYLCNMFIFKKEDFFEYSEFVFSVLNEILAHKELYIDGDNIQMRAPGFICEWLTTIYIYHAQRKHHRIFRESKLTFIKDTIPNQEIRKRKRNETKYALFYLICLSLCICTFGKIKLRGRRARYKENIRQCFFSANRKRHSSVSRFVYRGLNFISRIGSKIERIFTV